MYFYQFSICGLKVCFDTKDKAQQTELLLTLTARLREKMNSSFLRVLKMRSAMLTLC